MFWNFFQASNLNKYTRKKTTPTNNKSLIRAINHQVSFNKALVTPYSWGR